MVIFADIYIKRLIKEKKTYEEIYSEIKQYSYKHEYNEEEAIYFFILKIIKLKLFFTLNLEEYDELLYDAIYWSSKEENKKKTRPKKAKEIKVNKDNNKYIFLQKEIFKLIYEEYKDEVLFDEYLVKYLTMFFELSSIKRDRR